VAKLGSRLNGIEKVEGGEAMLMSTQSNQEKPVVILRRRMHPPYLKATVWGDVRALARRWREEQKGDTVKKSLSVNDVIRYIEYLRNRYPRLVSVWKPQSWGCLEPPEVV